ncbi:MULTISPECIES: hypothetical protein [unclassified Comamonas]|uniref:hypothetical protein n=1 Tax=unclassified Comamonas TaxID=2638500 RepID=UPI001ACE2984|nr:MULTISPECIES: hypothetical protein [unclassified Comamonas]MBN9331209.1 hypothetical protein [Comamonas sp.]
MPLHSCPPRRLRRSLLAAVLSPAALALASLLSLPLVCNAAPFALSGNGRFKPPTAEQLAALPANLPFTRADLASGTWSFQARYDDSVPDSDPDAWVGRYVGAVQAFRLVVGSTAIDLPVSQSEIVVSDGGQGFTQRESIRLEVKAPVAAGLLRMAWVQLNQQPAGTDLRGIAGVLRSDAMPAAAAMAQLPAANPADRFLELRIDQPDAANAAPLLYLSTSQPTVTASPITAP